MEVLNRILYIFNNLVENEKFIAPCNEKVSFETDSGSLTVVVTRGVRLSEDIFHSMR